jgi:hypothetical protein
MFSSRRNDKGIEDSELEAPQTLLLLEEIEEKQ